jgi:hypothetical protein
MTINHSIPQ